MKLGLSAYRKSENTPPDKIIQTKNGGELYRATGIEACIGNGDMDNPLNWYTEYVNSRGEHCYDRNENSEQIRAMARRLLGEKQMEDYLIKAMLAGKSFRAVLEYHAEASDTSLHLQLIDADADTSVGEMDKRKVILGYKEELADM